MLRTVYAKSHAGTTEDGSIARHPPYQEEELANYRDLGVESEISFRDFTGPDHSHHFTVFSKKDKQFYKEIPSVL